MGLTRRELLAAAAAAPIALSGAGSAAAAQARRRRVAIVGSGIAGTSLAWLLDGACDVVVLESRPKIGGHVDSRQLELNGERFVADVGAQYFNPSVYPVYSALLRELGIGPNSPELLKMTSTITLTGRGELLPRLVSPAPPDRWWPVVWPWNWPGLGASSTVFGAARDRERADRRALADQTVGQFVNSLPLDAHQRDDIVLGLMSALGGVGSDRVLELSALGVLAPVARALPDNPLDPIVYSTLRLGLVDALNRMLAQTSTVRVKTSAAVTRIVRRAGGGFRIVTSQGVEQVDDVVLAASADPSLHLLSGISGTERQRAALSRVDSHLARLVLHTDPVFTPNPDIRSFMNISMNGRRSQMTMWLWPLLGNAYPKSTWSLYKSWVDPDVPMPTKVLEQRTFRHTLPTPSTVSAGRAIDRLQGEGRVWFAGGYLHPFDSQEWALQTALRVAGGMGVSSRRLQILQPVAQRAWGGSTPV